MKKQFFGALALALMISLTSCRDNNDSAEETLEETTIQEEANLEVKTEEVSEMTETETVVDSIETTEPVIEQETPQI